LKSIEINGKVFQLIVPAEKIEVALDNIATKINKELKGKNPLFIGILNGAFMFCSDLMKRIDIECKVTFVKLKSYNGLQTSGKVLQTIGLTESIEGRTVIVVEDIVDSGATLFHFLNDLSALKPAEIKIASMFIKPDACTYKIQVDYSGIELPNRFVIGYGLDFDGLGRNYKDLYGLVE
jgi:hypoxanthine phosphoribosyltransferase